MWHKQHENTKCLHISVTHSQERIRATNIQILLWIRQLSLNAFFAVVFFSLCGAWYVLGRLLNRLNRQILFDIQSLSLSLCDMSVLYKVNGLLYPGGGSDHLGLLKWLNMFHEHDSCLMLVLSLLFLVSSCFQKEGGGRRKRVTLIGWQTSSCWKCCFCNFTLQQYCYSIMSCCISVSCCQIMPGVPEHKTLSKNCPMLVRSLYDHLHCVL